jgi:hypothetical protein
MFKVRYMDLIPFNSKPLLMLNNYQTNSFYGIGVMLLFSKFNMVKERFYAIH